MNRPAPESVPVVVTLEGIESADLKPEEAFVFSLVNGKASLAEIAMTVGFEEERVWTSLSRLVEAGFVQFEKREKKGKAVRKKRGSSILDQLDEEDRDPVLRKIPRSTRNEILLRHRKLDSQDHYGVLDTTRKGSFYQIRKNYFKLVKELHPDRFYRCELGHYREKLETLFQRITQAFDELRDPQRREKYDGTLPESDRM